jgi:putative transposase
MNRGDRREAIFEDDHDRQCFIETLGATGGKTGWQIHAYVLMGNHFHLVVETPQANPCMGMKWLLGTYTMRFNRRHKQWGHLFGGRYKAQLIDERDERYLVTACDYVHLNPARAGLLKSEEPLENYRWSSFVGCLKAAVRPNWQRVDRMFGEHGLSEERWKDRREFARRLESRRQEGMDEAQVAQLRRGWRFGNEDFVDWLVGKIEGKTLGVEPGAERRETDEAMAERLAKEGLAIAGWTEEMLSKTIKGHPVKVEIARQVRRRTAVTRVWIADRLKMGSASYVSGLLTVNSKD